MSGFLTSGGSGGGPPSGAAGGALSGTYPNPAIVLTSNSSISGILPAANQASQSLTITGDVTSSGGTTAAATATLATVNTNVGSFGSTTTIPTFTVNGKGLITAASSVSLSASGLPTITLTGDTTGAAAGGSIATTTGKIQGNTVTSGALIEGDLLIATSTSNWAATAVTGDVGFSSSVPGKTTLISIDGYSLPSPGSPNAGLLLSSGSALSWSELSQDGTINSSGALTVTQLDNGQITVSTVSTATTVSLAKTGQTYTISQPAASSGAGANLTISPQAATSTGASGSLVVALSAPASGTAEAALEVTRGGTLVAALGQTPSQPTLGTLWLGNSAPTTSNYAITSTNANTYVNGVTTTNLQVNGTTYLQVASGVVSLDGSSGFTLQFQRSVTAPSIIQQAQNADTATVALTIQAQSALTTASTNTTGGNLILEPGAGASSNSTYQSGNVIVNLQAGNSTSAVGYFEVEQNNTIVAALGQLPGHTNIGCLWLGNAAPTSSNYAMTGTNTSTTILGPTSSGTVFIAINGADYVSFTEGSTITNITNYAATNSLSINSTALTADQVPGSTTVVAGSAWPSATTHITGANLLLSSGLGAANGSAAASEASGQLLLQAGGNSVSGCDGYSMFLAQTSGIALTNANITLTAAQMLTPYLAFTGTLTGSVTVTLVASTLSGFARHWYVDLSGITFSSHTITFSIGTGATTVAISALTTNSTVIELFNPSVNVLTSSI
jgi:hypothetical protein